MDLLLSTFAFLWSAVVGDLNAFDTLLKLFEVDKADLGVLILLDITD